MNGEAIVNSSSGSILTLNRVIIENVQGIGFSNGGTATLNDVTIRNCVYDDDFNAAGVSSFGDQLTINGGTITNNRATGEFGTGGGIGHYDGILVINGTLISGNSATFGGGGVLIAGADSEDVTATLNNVQILNNSAQIGAGVGILGARKNEMDSIRSTTVSIVNSKIENNTGITAAGIAVAANVDEVTPQVTITNTSVSNNQAEQNASGTITVNQGGIQVAVPRGNSGGIGITRGNVTITGGSVSGNSSTFAGGIGIDAGTLTVTGTQITGNSAIAGAGLVGVKASSIPTITITGANISGNMAPTNATGTIKYEIPNVDTPEVPRGVGGGLIIAGANAVVVNTTIDGNIGTGAAGVALAQGTLTLNGSTISRNRAIGTGSSAIGGGLGMLGGTLNLTNTTIDSNSAPVSGGVAIGAGTASIAFSTITSNTASTAVGGLGSKDAVVTIRSTVIAQNFAPIIQDVTGTITSGGNNFIGVGDGSTGFGGSDRLGSAAAPLQPYLAPLGNYGGPTQTRLPLPASPLLDMAGGMTPGTDQRGVARPFGAAADIGAVERTASDPIPAPKLPSTYAAGPDVGAGSPVVSFNPDGSTRLNVDPGFPAGFTGGVRVAEADFNGDGIADVAVGTGPGIATLVKVFDGVSGAEIFSIAPFEESFLGGINLAAGDLTGDGIAELVITPDEGGGPRVQVFLGRSFTKVADFFGIDDPNFRGGARTAIGDVNGDGVGDLIVAAGFSGGPRVAVFNGISVLNGSPVKLFNDFFAFEDTLRNGVYIAAGDVNGDGFADLILGGGPGGGPRVRIADGMSLINGVVFGLPDSPATSELANFFAGDTNSRGGIRLAAKDLDGDNLADIVAGAGTGAGSLVTTYLGKTITPTETPPVFTQLEAFPGFAGGVFVG